jgi:hypothetical protein
MIRRTLRTTLLLVLVGLCADGHRARAQSPVSGVVTRADLEAAGIHRLSELMQWVGGWNLTVDGLSWSVSPDGLPTAALPRAGLPEWTLLVDGQRVDVAALGAWLPELAPTAVQQIDSVRVVRTPGIAGGAFTSRGVLHVFTRRAPAGVSVHTWIRTGGETGDPGPYLFTPHATANVDRTGADVVGVVGYGSQRWNAQISFREINHSMTDPRLIERYHTKESQSYTTAGGPAVRLEAEVLGGRHVLLLGHTDHVGFIFLPARGRMERSALTLTHVGATGSLALRPRTHAAYRLTRSGHLLGREPDRFPAFGTHRRSLSHASAELSHRTDAWWVRTGIGVDERVLRLEGVPESEQRIHTTLFGEVEHESSAAWSQRYAAALVQEGDRVGFRASASAIWQPDSARSLSGSFSAMQQLPDEGTAWMDARTVEEGRARPNPQRTLLWSEIVWQQELTRAIAWDIGAVYGSIAESRGAAGETASLSSGSSPDTLGGGRFGVRAGLSLDAPPHLRGRVLYHSIAPLAASEDLVQAMETIPDHLLQGSLTYTPVPNFRLGLLLDYRTSLGWRGRELSRVSGKEKIDPVSRVDLSIEKWLWMRRVHTQLVLRNLLNTPERYHPFGAQFDRRFFLGASVRLPHDRASAPQRLQERGLGR